MKKRESLFIRVGLVVALCGVGAVLWQHRGSNYTAQEQQLPTSKYGAFLAAQHAIYVNDFERAAQYSQQLTDLDFAVVTGTRYMSEFLSGRLPDNAENLKDEKSVPAQLVYEAYLLKNDNWEDVYKRHKKDTSALSAPLRIWSSVATGNTADALEFIDSLPTHKSWKDFVRGQVYAETGDINQAASSFALVRTDFMNISDYLYMMSFYQQNGMTDAAAALRADFASSPGGMYMLGYDSVPQWSTFSGYKNALAFSLVQNVSHTQIMMYSDLAILLLRFAQITGPDFGQDSNAINYYIGQYFYNNRGDWAHYFDKIEESSPFYAFATLRRAEKGGNIHDLERVARDNPLFVPAIQKIVAYHIKNGNRRSALRVINRALGNSELSETGRAFLLKSRAQVYFVFGDMDAAQKDLHGASEILVADSEIISLQAKIWAAQHREIENAYDYAMTLVRQNPADIMAWETVGRVVWVRESAADALDLIERVGNVAAKDSALFDLLGDLYVAAGQQDRAHDAYMRAINLSDDGLVVVPEIEKKLRKLK